MIIDCIADLHGYYPKLEGGDLLIVAGDLTANDKPIEYGHLGCWIQRQNYKKKILIAGNHDNYFDRKGFEFIEDIFKSINVEYLCDSGTEFEGLKIWGSPWTAQFPGINPKCCAFTVDFGFDTDDWLNEYWQKIPSNTDILITHCPPFGILDKPKEEWHVGSISLRDNIFDRIKPKFHLFGHIHEWGGISVLVDGFQTNFINCSYVNERYQPVNKPVRIEL